MKGAFDFICLGALAMLGLFLSTCFFLWLFGLLPVNRDESDASGRGGGVKAVTDDLTGCQYLGFQNGGITPRMDAQGRHLCIPVENKGE